MLLSLRHGHRVYALLIDGQREGRQFLPPAPLDMCPHQRSNLIAGPTSCLLQEKSRLLVENTPKPSAPGVSLTLSLFDKPISVSGGDTRGCQSLDHLSIFTTPVHLFSVTACAIFQKSCDTTFSPRHNVKSARNSCARPEPQLAPRAQSPSGLLVLNRPVTTECVPICRRYGPGAAPTSPKSSLSRASGMSFSHVPLWSHASPTQIDKRSPPASTSSAACAMGDLP
jgi:hypothetical protein